MTLLNKKIGVIGGGIGGLASAIAFAKFGSQVTLYEKALAISEVGAGIQISANGINVLTKLGIYPDYLKSVGFPKNIIFKDYKTDKAITEIQHNQDLNLPYMQLHRADLIEALVARAKSLGVNIVLGSKAKVINSGGSGSKIKVNNSEVFDFDLTVAADGMNSTVRQYWFGQRPSVFMKQIAWRALIPSNGMSIEPTVYMGINKHLVMYPLRNGKIINIIGVQSNENLAPESWNNEGSPEKFNNEFSDFNTSVTNILSDITEVKLWGLYSHPTLKSWSHKNVVLLGDAAHPMLPFMAQGSCMALEDAAVLARVLNKINNIDTALKKYENIRKKRVTAVQKTSIKNGKFFHINNLILRKFFHITMLFITKLHPSFLKNRYNWIYNYKA